MSSTKPSVTKRACDGCKIRKIRCGGGQPCRSCTKAGIKCTYVRVQQCRGPRRLRSTTQYLIEQAQSNGENYDVSVSPRLSDASIEKRSSNTTPMLQGTEGDNSRIPTDILTSPLSIYHVRMYPVWPIVNVGEVVSVLQQDPDGHDNETYALATALTAATIAQLRLEQTPGAGDSMTADNLAAECLRARDLCNYRLKASLNGIRTSFFLHVYYENQKSGGTESLLYLREAISMAQMMGLHREASYSNLSFEERQLRRRIIWLLFVTERFPVALKTNISAPEVDEHDESQVLPAFLKLLGLFQNFEKSGMFDIIQDETSELQPGANQAGHVDWPFLESLQRNLQDGSMLFDHISDVQKADLCVTRHWMRMILWKLSPKNPLTSSPSADQSMSLCFPVSVAKELVGIVSQLPRSAIEAHGLGMELKIYEVANSLADAISNRAVLPHSPEWDGDNRPNYILFRLHSILSTFRGGGNKKLVDILYRKMAEAQLLAGPSFSAPLRTSARKSPGSRKRRRSSVEHEARANDQDARRSWRSPEPTNHDSISGGAGNQYPDIVDPLDYQFDASDLVLASVSDLGPSQDACYQNQVPQYVGGDDLFGPPYDGTTSGISQFLLDPSNVAIASEAVQVLSPIWSSFMPMNTTSDDLASHSLRTSTQDLLFPGPDFTTYTTSNDFVGLY
ncbi:hypothetical protein BBP40_005488 [Aspergillus hancockii]|nr:hypothetical protein BBP40_005488 [Aspergillus hancockii]